MFRENFSAAAKRRVPAFVKAATALIFAALSLNSAHAKDVYDTASKDVSGTTRTASGYTMGTLEIAGTTDRDASRPKGAKLEVKQK